MTTSSSTATAFVCGLAASACNSAERAEQQRIAEAYSRFSQCVVGAPLGSDEDPHARLRAILLTERGNPSREGLPPNARWPRHCKGETSGFHSALAAATHDRAAIEELQLKLYAQVVAFDSRSDLEGLGEVLLLARKAALRASEIPGARRAPDPTRPLLAAPDPVPFQYVFRGAAVTDAFTLGVWKSGDLPVIQRASERRLCTDPFGASPMVCKKVDLALTDLHLAAGPPGQIWYYDARKANQSRELIVTSLDGTTKKHALSKDFAASGVRVEPELLVTLDVNQDAHRFELSLERDAGEKTLLTGTFEAHSHALFQNDSPPFLAGDFVVTGTKSGIQVRRIQRDPPKLLEPEQVLGSETVMPLVHGDQVILIGHASDPAKSGIALFDGNRWQAHAVEVHLPRAVAYGPARVRLQSKTEDDGIRELRCEPAGCKTEEHPLRIGRSFCGPVFAPLGERTLVMWRSDLGDVRMRVGPLAHIDAASDVVVLDEGPPPDDASASECIQLISQGDRVLAVIESFRKGRLALLVDASANVKELPLTRPLSP